MAIVPNLAGGFPTDLRYASANRKAATTAAVMALTPIYGGELVLTADAGLMFRSQSLTVGDWALVTLEK